MAYLVGKEIRVERTAVWAIIERLLAGLALSMNVGKNLQPHQLDGLAKKIYAKYYYFSFDELLYVFDKGASGGYGKIYDRIDEEIIFTWLESFDTGERIQIAENANVSEIESYEEQKKAELEFLSRLLEPVAQVLEEEKQKEENYKKFREQYFKK